MKIGQDKILHWH